MVAECLLNIRMPYLAFAKIRNTKGCASRVFFELMLWINRVTFKDIYSLFEGFVAQLTGTTRRANTNAL